VRVVLYEPQIPANTGNILRTCACTGASLTLVEPLGFHTSDRALKRAGLDYWLGVDVEKADDIHTYLQDKPFWLFTTHTTQAYTDVPYTPNDLLVFGSETTGLPQALIDRHPERTVRIPMLPSARCLNLSNAVAVALYEMVRRVHPIELSCCHA
jgi:tRNA (cytidine/uridine-2'-O-)-methyltransferase